MQAAAGDGARTVARGQTRSSKVSFAAPSEDPVLDGEEVGDDGRAGENDSTGNDVMEVTIDDGACHVDDHDGSVDDTISPSMSDRIPMQEDEAVNAETDDQLPASTVCHDSFSFTRFNCHTAHVK